MRHYNVGRNVLLACGLACGLGSSLGSLPSIPPIELTNNWTPIRFPDTPLGISEHQGKLWTVGANEMIAVSADGGASWTMKHYAKPGEMLFFISFLDDRTAYAMGSGRDWLKSVDGGETWKPVRGMKQTWDSGQFTGPTNGIVASVDGWAVTSDAGKTWQAHGLPLPPDPGVKPPDPKLPVPPVPLLHSPNRQVLQIAAVDATHAGLLFANESGSQPWLTTADGGRSWNKSTIPNLAVDSIRAADGLFWVYGVNYQGLPMALSTSDEAHWNPMPPLPAVFSQCTPQGCRVPGGWAQLAGPSVATAKLWQLPPALPAFSTTAWAAGAASVCDIGDGKLVCAAANQAWTAPASTSGRVEVNYKDLKVQRWAAVSLPGQTYDSQGPDTHEGTVLLRIVLGPDGRPASVQVLGAAWADLAQEVVSELKTWHFAPVTVDGKPVEAETTLPYIFNADSDLRTNPGAPVSSHGSLPGGCCR